MQTNYPHRHWSRKATQALTSIHGIVGMGIAFFIYLALYANTLAQHDTEQALQARLALKQTVERDWKDFEARIGARLVFLTPALEQKALGALQVALVQLATEHPMIESARINSANGEAWVWHHSMPSSLPPKMATPPRHGYPNAKHVDKVKLFAYQKSNGVWNIYGHWRIVNAQNQFLGTLQLTLSNAFFQDTLQTFEQASARELAMVFAQGAVLSATTFEVPKQDLHVLYMDANTTLASIPNLVLRSKKNPAVVLKWVYHANLVGLLYAMLTGLLLVFKWQYKQQRRHHQARMRTLRSEQTKQQQRVQLALDSAGLGMWEFIVGQTNLLADRAFYTMHGLPQQTSLSVDEWVALVHPSDRSTFKTLLLHAGIHGKSFECTYANIQSNKQNTRYVQCRAKAHTNKRTGLVHIAGITIDVTVQKKYELSLQEMEARFRTSFEWAAIGMAIIDPKGQFLQVNHTLCAMLEYEDHELLNMQASGIVHPQELTYHQKFLDDIFKRRCDSFHLETRCQNAKGVTLWAFMSVAAVRQHNGRVLHFVVQIKDITERKRQEVKLLEREHFLRTLSECLPGLVSYWDTNLHCQFANQNHSKWIGIEASRLRGQHLKNVLGETIFSLCQANIEGVLQGKRQRFEMHLVTQDHHETDFLVHFIPDIVRQQVNGFFAISTNISALKTHQRELEQINQTLTERTIQAEAASKAKGAFLANMSHEIRTPMNGIMGVLQLLEDTPLNSQQHEYLGQIGSAADVLMNVLNDILDLSRVEANKLELDIQRFDLESVLNKSIGLFNYRAHEKKIKLFCVKNLNCPVSLEGDPLRLAQVLNNLLSNAIKFTEKGHIEVQVKCSEDQQMLEWQMKDTGIGMNEQQCQALFKPFSQVDDSASRRYGGAGLGLSICKNLIELMGGNIHVESTPKEGTRFTFTIPNRNPSYTVVVQNEADDAASNTAHSTDLQPSKATSEQCIFQGQTILVADDHKLNRLVASEMLKKWGATVMLAENGLEAVAACQEQRFDLILMDLQMPEMDGFAATAAILQALGDKAPPIVAVTASTGERDRQAILEAGMAEHITKPFKKEKLKAILLGLCIQIPQSH